MNRLITQDHLLRPFMLIGFGEWIQHWSGSCCLTDYLILNDASMNDERDYIAIQLFLACPPSRCVTINFSEMFLSSPSMKQLKQRQHIAGIFSVNIRLSDYNKRNISARWIKRRREKDAMVGIWYTSKAIFFEKSSGIFFLDNKLNKRQCKIK